jgi:O-acetyl-ADP-ribose deacetylase (regulator of RNase III)
MKFYLRDRNEKIAEEWKKFFGDNADFDISVGDIFSGPTADAIVSPANSFGFMDGGIDAAYIHKFHPQLEFRLRDRIQKHFNGELLVGQATIIPTGAGTDEWRYLISAPTMRVPGVVKHTVNAYLAFRAVLLAVKKWNVEANTEPHINSIMCPGLGTAIGQIPPFACARQMFEAYQAIWLDKPIDPEDCADIWYNQQELLGWPPTDFKVNGVERGEVPRKGDAE